MFDRRQLVLGLGALGVAGCGTGSAARGLKIVVAGAGIVGAAIAWNLAKAGAEVTVIDEAGPVSKSSRATFAWINASWAKQPRIYHQWSQSSVKLWRDLQEPLKLPLRWGGSLEWFEDPADQARLVPLIAEQAEWREPARMIDDGEVAALEPNLALHGANSVAWSGNDGAVDPVLAASIFLNLARSFNARVEVNCSLNSVTFSKGRLAAVETSCGTIKADRLVLATGAKQDAALKFAGVAIPQRTTPGIIVVTEPMEPIIKRVIVAPGVHIHQRNDGRLVIGEQDGPPDDGAHAIRLQGRPDKFPDPAIAAIHARRMIDRAANFIPQIAKAVASDVMIGWRPRPNDELPVLGPSPERPDIYFAIMHSGVTLAPIVGELTASAIGSSDSVIPKEFRYADRFS